MAENKNEKYRDLSKDDLLKVIEKLESRKKYGLIWDEEKVKEQFEKDSVNALPILKEIKGKEIKTKPDEPINILIEGDNYHALSVLNFTHQGKVDVIYIDPPYNTGNKDFTYNDDYVDAEDEFRHSKWLSFISKRLRLSKTLLNSSGIIFISINDIEIAQLKMLCDEIFNERNFLANLVWQNKEGGGSSDSKHFRIKHEYILVYSKNKDSCFIEGDDISNLDRYKLKDKYEKIRGPFYLQKLGMGSIQYSSSLDYEIMSPDGKKIEPKDNNNGKRACWRWSKEKLKWGIENDFIVFKKDSKDIWQVYTKQYLNCDNEGNEIESVQRPFGVVDLFSSTQAAKELRDMDINGFSYPKPRKLISYLISKHPKNNAVVLDFMAGTGTTGHAVLDLNNKDNGSRSFILCTDNELNGIGSELAKKFPDKDREQFGICKRVCYPRIEKAVKGYKNLNDEKVVGLGGNLKYFKTRFVKKTINKDDMKIKLTRECTEMLCIREGVFDEKEKTVDYAIFEQNGRIMAVYYSIERKGLKELKKEMDKMKGEKTLYCFTLDPLGLDKSDFANWKDTQLEPIPQKILEVYEEIYEY
jgi:adenine-specific DNA-methyltransferase